MNSRLRVLTALDHHSPDRPPLDLGGHRSSGMMAIAYANLKKAMGISSGDIYVYDMVQQLAIIEPTVMDALGVDTIEMGRGFLTEPGDWKDWVLPGGTPCKIPYYINVEPQGEDWILKGADGTPLAIQKKGCLYFEQTHYPLLERGIAEDDFEDLPQAVGHTVWAGVPHPGAHLPLDTAGLAEMARRAQALRQSTDRAILGLFGGNMFEIPQWLYRMDLYLTYLGLYPDQVHRMSERLCAMHMENLEKWLGAVGPYIDVILFGDDLGGQMGPLLSPAMYREYVKPYHARLWKRAKQLAPHVKTLLHCCGGVEPLLGDLIEAGLDAINPVQITCKGMDSRTLKETYGEQLCLWGGGCDTRSILPLGTPDQVRQHVLEQVETLSPGGGFVFQQVHNIMANVPPQNVLAMVEALHG